MSVVLGIDVGGSTTKIVGFRGEGQSRELIRPLFVRAADPITSIYGALGKFTSENSLDLSDIKKVLMTGVGSSYVNKGIYSLDCESVPEFRSIGTGGLFLSGLREAVVISMGTGTAAVYAKEGEEPVYLGGTGVGGGTLMGLSKMLLKLDDISHIEQLARNGDLSKIDLRISDITKKDILSGVSMDLTASNFGKVSDLASKEDIAKGILNMVFETVGMIAIFAARSYSVRDIVLTGNLTRLAYCHDMFARLSDYFHVNFLIPEMSEFATVIGTALCG